MTSDPPTVSFGQWSRFKASLMKKQSFSTTESPVAKTPQFAAAVTENAIQQACKTAVPKSTQADIL